LARVPLDTRDSPQGSPGFFDGEPVSLRLALCLSNRACDTLLPVATRRDPMRMGYVGRNSETELSRWAACESWLDAPRPPSTVISLEVVGFWLVVVCAVSRTAACRIQNFAEACCSWFWEKRHASPSVRLRWVWVQS